MGKPNKDKKPISKAPKQFEKDPELNLTEMQNAFVWHYTEGSCSQTEAARRAGYEFPAVAANRCSMVKTNLMSPKLSGSRNTSVLVIV